MYLTIGGWGWGDLSYKKLCYSYNKKIFTGRTKPIRIIGGPDNQLPNKWSSTVLQKVKGDRNILGTVQKNKGG